MKKIIFGLMALSSTSAFAGEPRCEIFLARAPDASVSAALVQMGYTPTSDANAPTKIIDSTNCVNYRYHFNDGTSAQRLGAPTYYYCESSVSASGSFLGEATASAGNIPKFFRALDIKVFGGITNKSLGNRKAYTKAIKKLVASMPECSN